MKLFILGAVTVASVILPFQGFGAEAGAVVSPEADALLKQVGEFHRGLKSASADFKVVITQDIPGRPKQEQTMDAAFAVARPNRLALKMKTPTEGSAALLVDGKTVWTYVEELKQYVVDDAPATLENLLRDHASVAMFMGQMGPVTELFRDRPRELILQGVATLKVVGKESLDGVECIRLRGEQPEMDWDAWFQSGAQPALRKFTFSPLKGMLATAPDEMKEKLKSAKLDVVVSYNAWKFDAEQPEATFAFQPPKDAKKVAQLGPEEDASAGAPGDGPETLKGKAAEDFTLDLLAGGKVQLAGHKGKDVVVLDFWATWCGPCVRALPALGEVAAAFKDKGVVVYALNQQEEAEVVKKFVEAKKLTIPVAMDAKGDVAKAYKVRGIPQTVIIGKEGKIAAVHVGFSPGLKDSLTKEIEALLAK